MEETKQKGEDTEQKDKEEGTDTEREERGRRERKRERESHRPTDRQSCILQTEKKMQDDQV